MADLAAVNPSGFEAWSELEKCNGCSRCARACPIGSIAMTPVRAEASRKNKLAPAVNGDRCIGCGVCADVCVRKAMQMVRRKEKPYIPANAVEKAIRMALERNRLADLLFDQGHGLGNRFLHHALKVLSDLPVAKRILASEQLRSRFVNAALARIKDPTG